MKKLLSIGLVAIAVVTFVFTGPAWADGAATFNANCASCHMKGGNIIDQSKTLSMADLEKNNMNDVDKIITQVTNGKGGMPAGGTGGAALASDADKVAEVAAYVLSQAEAGW